MLATGAIVPHGQFEAIRNDIPLLSDATQELSGQSQQSWIAHSWGGVLMSSALAFDHSLADRVVRASAWNFCDGVSLIR